MPLLRNAMKVKAGDLLNRDHGQIDTQDCRARPPSASLRSRLHTGSKCNEALSRDLWPLDPFESAPMRATSSGMGYCILCAIQLRLEIKELAELLSGKAGSNSLTLKKLLGGIFPNPPTPNSRSLPPEFITWLQSPARFILTTTIPETCLLEDCGQRRAHGKFTGMPRVRLTAR